MPYVFNVVQGRQRATTYYLTNLEFGEVAQLVELPENLLGEQLFDNEQTMQRKLQWSRVRGDMANYLLTRDDAFYSSLTLMMIPRDLSPLEDGDGYEFRPLDGNGGQIGKLTIRGNLVLFPADGQHRVASIKEALKKNPSLANVAIPVVLIPFRSRPKVRQLFSDLNQHAKPVNKTIARSFETRDLVALVAKAVEGQVPLFAGRVNHMSNSLAQSSDNVITLNSLYEGTETLLRGLGYDLDKLTGEKFTDIDVAKYAQEVAAIWQPIIAALPDCDKVGKVPPAGRKPGDLRNDYVFPHGIGWQALALAASVMAQEADSGWLQKLEATLKKIDWAKTNAHWQNICMVGDRLNNTGPGIRATAGYILWKAWVVGGKAGVVGAKAVPLVKGCLNSIAASNTSLGAEIKASLPTDVGLGQAA